MTEPLLPDTTTDEQPVGWGDDVEDDGYAGGVEDPDVQRLVAERPPHHDRP